MALPTTSTRRPPAAGHTAPPAPAHHPWAILPPTRITAAVGFVYLMWFITLCDPQWWIAAKTVSVVRQIPTPLYGLMLVWALLKMPKSWFPPLLAFIVYTVVLIVPAYNRGYAIGVAKILVAFYVLGIGTLALLRTIPQSVPIIAGHMMYAYLWWVGLGAVSGRVSWHHSLANYDGYGPLMVMGVGSCYYFGLATQVKKERTLAYLAAVGCIVGLVSSYARGAVLSGAVVMGWMWLRSRYKVRTTVAAIAGAVLITIAGSLVTSRSEKGLGFFAEMATIADDAGDGVQSDRDVLWALATQVFLDHPLFGVGANNFGPYAAGRFVAGETGGQYDQNPQRLYDRQLHSTYYQILCEYGLVGSALFVWMLVDFWIRNRALRRRSFRENWAERSGGRLDLHSLSLGLECAMLGFLTTSVFYNQIFNIHWLYTLIVINTLLFYHARPSAQYHRLRAAGARA